MLNDVYVTVAGVRYSRWKSLNITKSLETLTSSFELVVTDDSSPESNNDWPLRTQEECIISIDKDQLIKGYIDNVTCDVDTREHKITIAGRDKTSDVVDCSYVSDKTSWSKITLLALTNKLIAPFGLKAKLADNVSDTKSFSFSVDAGDSIFDNLRKKANNFGKLLVTDSNGDILITNSGNTKMHDSLILESGGNIIRGTSLYKYTQRFSDYTVYAQGKTKGKWKTNINVKVTAKDEGVLRYRPKLIKASSPLDKAGAQAYANWEALVRAGKSQEVTVTVQGFRQSTNELWNNNSLVDIYAPALYVNPATELLITSVQYIVNNNGTFTKMTLKRKDAFEQKPASVGKTVKAVSTLGWDKLKRAVREELQNLGVGTEDK